MSSVCTGAYVLSLASRLPPTRSETMFSVAKGHPRAGPMEARPPPRNGAPGSWKDHFPVRKAELVRPGRGGGRTAAWLGPDLQEPPGGWTEGPGRGLCVPGAPRAARGAGAPRPGAGPAGLFPAGIWNTSTSHCSRGHSRGRARRAEGTVDSQCAGQGSSPQVTPFPFQVGKRRPRQASGQSHDGGAGPASLQESPGRTLGRLPLVGWPSVALSVSCLRASLPP